MKALINLTVERRGREWIGEAVARVLREAEPARLVAVVPRIVTFFADMPRRYEVTEVDLIVEVEQQLRAEDDTRPGAQ
jgi:hypothetical protein